MKNLYEFLDRRNEEYLETNDVFEAYEHIFKRKSDKSEKYTLMCIREAGYLVSDLPNIDTLIHSVNNGPQKVQLTFNDGKDPVLLDVYVTEFNGQRYINIDFLNKDSDEKMWRRLYDKHGNEKNIEWCSSCESEVVLDHELKCQKCPLCGERIVPCNICTHGDGDYNCKECGILEGNG